MCKQEEIIALSFYDYINSYRVEEIKEVIQSVNLKQKTILTVAMDCGFNSKSTFNRIFKNKTGNTPSQYIKSLKEA